MGRHGGGGQQPQHDAPEGPDIDAVRVLLVDDQVDLRFLLGLTLRNDPRFEVVGEAGDGDAALAAIRELRPDLVLLDLEMPRRNGLEVLEALRDEVDPPVVVVLSGVATPAVAELARRGGAVDVLGKDTPPARLLSRVLERYAAA